MSGPNDTLDMSDYPPACRDSLEAACNEYAETVYRLRNAKKQLREALAPFVKRGAGLYFDTHTRRDGMAIIKCRQCNSWTGKEVDDFRHESECPYTKALAALMAEES